MATILPKLNSAKFLDQFDRFKRLVLVHDGRDFSSFGSGLPSKEECYKEEVYHKGRDRLAWQDWTEAEIGSGDILRRVIAAIEIKESNLVDWDLRRGPEARSHHALCVAIEKRTQLVAWESLFYDFYRDELSAEEVFHPLLELAGRRTTSSLIFTTSRTGPSLCRFPRRVLTRRSRCWEWI